MSGQNSIVVIGTSPESTQLQLFPLIIVALVCFSISLNLQAKGAIDIVTIGTQGSSAANAYITEKPRIGLVVGHAGIDPETGLHDPGFRCPDGLTEVKVNRAVARIAARGLESLGFHVDLMDEFDERLSSYRAIALISIHTDSCTPDDIDAAGYKVAGALNTGTPERTQRLVDCLAERYGRVTKMAYLADFVTYDMTDFHTFSEIDDQTPAAIIEIGYLLLDREFVSHQPDNIARALIDGIQCYYYQQPVFD